MAIFTFHRGAPDYVWQDLIAVVLQNGTILPGADADSFSLRHVEGSTTIDLRFEGSGFLYSSTTPMLLAGNFAIASIFVDDLPVMTVQGFLPQNQPSYFAYNDTISVFRTPGVTAEEMESTLGWWVATEPFEVYGSDDSEALLFSLNYTNYGEGGGGADFMRGGNFADELYGEAGNDTIHGGEGEDTLVGGSGDDQIDGEDDRDFIRPGSGNDIVDGGDGWDELVFSGGGVADHVNVIVDGVGSGSASGFQGGSAASTTFSGIEAIRGTDTTDTFTVTASGSGTPFSSSIDDLYFAVDMTGGRGSDHFIDQTDHGVLLVRYDIEDLIESTGRGVYLNVSGQSITIDFETGPDVILQTGQGMDTFGETDTYSGVRGFVLTVNHDLFVGGDAGYFVNARSGNDYVESGAGKDFLIGGDGNDYIYSGGGDDELQGGEGADTLDGGTGFDRVSYKFERREDGTLPGHGVAVNLSDNQISVALPGGGWLYVDGGYAFDAFGSFASPNTSFDRLISVENVDGSSLDDHIVGSTVANVLRGGEGNDYLYGGNGNDTLEGGLGRDTLDGGSNDDTYILRASEGGTLSNPDVIHEGIGGGIDTIRIDGVAPIDVRISSTATALILGLTASDGGVSYFALSSSLIQSGGVDRGMDFHQRFERVEFDDGTVWDLTQGLPSAPSESGDTLFGTPINEVLAGGAGDDTLRGYDGDDTLDGGEGQDSVEGGAGNDTYILRAGDGSSTYYPEHILEDMNAGIDTIRIVGLLPSQVTTAWRGDAMVLGLTSPSGGHTYFELQSELAYDSALGRYVGSTFGQRYERVEFDDGTVWDLTAVPTGGDGNDTLIGSAQGEVLSGAGGDDTISGYDGNDTLFGGLGRDSVSGGYGDDTYLLRAGDGGGYHNPEVLSEEIGAGSDSIRIVGVGPENVSIGLSTYRGINYVELSLDASGIGANHWIIPATIGADGISSLGDRFERIEFDDGTVWDLTLGLAGGNQAPVAAADQASGLAGMAIYGFVLTNDTDPDGGRPTAAVLASAASHGAVSLDVSGAFTYVPQAGFVGTDAFTYRASDGLELSDAVTVTIEVLPNAAPVSADDRYTVEEGKSLSVWGDGVLANDTDPEGRSLSATLVEGPQHGTLYLNANGSFTYTPNEGYLGQDSFTYQASDGVITDTATVTLTVEHPVLALDVPGTLAPGQTGTATLEYFGTGAGEGPALIFIKGTGALVADPVTGALSDGVFVLATVGQTTELTVKMAASQATSSVSAAVADAAQAINWVQQGDGLRPDGLSDAAWARAFTAFQFEAGNTVGSLVAELTESATRLASFGMGASSASSALAFEIEQAADFGSFAARSNEGSLGTGWAFLGDLQLDVRESGEVVVRGLASFDALSLLDARAVASYTLSNSVDRGVDLTGALTTAVPVDTRFVRDVTGSYSGGAGIGGTLEKTSTGYTLAASDGRVLAFDTAGKFLSMTDSHGQLTATSYDSAGNMTGLAGPNGKSLTITYNPDGTVSGVSDAGGHAVAIAYDGDGRLASASSAAGSAGFTYNAGGDLDSSATSGNPTLSFTYEAGGRLASIAADGGGGSESYTYDGSGGYTMTDAAGRTTTVELIPGGAVGRVTDGNGQSSSLVYDANGKLIGIEGADGTQTSLEFDDKGRLTTITDGNGAVLTFGYTGDGTQPTSFTDANGNTRTYTYNDAGQITQATWPDDTFLAFTYDADGNMLTATNRRGETTTYSYDDDGNLAGASQTDAGPASYGYDAQGRLTAVTTPDGTTEIAYDAAGRVTEIEYPNGRSLAYEYDDAGRRTSLTDQDGGTTEYEYDSAGRLAAVSDGGDNRIEYDYDASGNLVREENSNGTTTDYTYDDGGRLVSIVNTAVGGAVTSQFTYSYNDAGQRSGVVTTDGTWTYGYDDAGQLTSAEFVSTRDGVANKSIAYVYDDAGNRISSTEDGVTTYYAANGLNQYTSAGAATFTYDDDGNMVGKVDASGTWSFDYNSDNRLIRVEAGNGSVTGYEYDAFGNRSAVIVDGVRSEYLVDPFGYGNVVSEYGAGGSLAAQYLHGLGLGARIGADGSGAFYDLDAVASVVGVTGASGALANSYAYTPFGTPLWESETIANAFEYNGGLGVSEDANGLHYMRARSYDAELGRFTAEDPLWLSGDAGNLYRFAYNDPTYFVDPTGELVPLLLAGGAFAVNAVSGYYAAGATRTLLEGGSHSGAAGTAALSATPLAVGALVGTISVPSTLGFATGVLLNILFHPSPAEAAPIGPVDIPTGASDGDPHLSTFDGVGYSFQAVGEFTLVRGDNFEIQTRQEAVGESVSVNTATVMRIGENVVGVYAKGTDHLIINGQAVHLSVEETIAVGGGSVHRVSYGGLETYEVTNEQGDGFWVTVYGGANHLRPFISEERAGLVSGLLGNANGNRHDDMALADGTVLGTTLGAHVLYGAFADSWRITQEESLFVYGEGQSTETFTDRNFPREVATYEGLDPALRAAAEAIVRAAGVPEGTQAFRNAVLDVALSGDPSFANAAANVPQAEDEPMPIVVQRAPTAFGDTATVDEDASVEIDVLANDADPEGDELTLVWGSDPNGGLVTVVDNKLVFAPRADFSGDTTLNYTVTDGHGNNSAGTVKVTVNPLPDAPTIVTTDTFDQAENISAVAVISGIDPDLDTLTYSIAGGADAALFTIDPATGQLTFVARPDFENPTDDDHDNVYHVIVQVSDGTLFDTRELTVTITDGTGVTIAGTGGDDIVDATHTAPGQPLPTNDEDTIFGNGGNDTLDGGEGADTMLGGLGDDTYYVDSAQDAVTEFAGEGIDTVVTTLADSTLGANFENLVLGEGSLNGTGNALDNIITGNVGSNILDGGTGADTMIGAGGNDTYHVQHAGDVVVESAGGGTDIVYASSVSHELSAEVEHLTLLGTYNIAATGNDLSNHLVGNSGRNRLTGNAGDDTLDGGLGIDTMVGGLGDDTYYVEHVRDAVTEGANQGIDTVYSSLLSYTLTGNVENLILEAPALDGTGNALNNEIYGNAAANVLDGGAGADTLVGGEGNDTYYVQHAGDIATEGANGGIDTVYASLVSYALAEEIENLTLLGTYNIGATGNELDNHLVGNSGRNELLGGAGSDTLDGGTGIDTLVGGLGDDLYYVDRVGEVVTEFAGEGDDTIVSSIAAVALSANVERLILATGSAARNGTGNSSNNTIVGNEFANVLNGGAGGDTMSGGVGDDTYYVENVGDLVIEEAGGGHDTVYVSLISYELGDNLENLTLQGTYNIEGAGNALNNVIVGNAGRNRLSGKEGDDTLDGGAGVDTLIGGLGDDTYRVDNIADVVMETAGQGSDLVIASVSGYVLSGNVENLTLAAGVVVGTGNSLNNVITGSASANVLDGGSGADTMIGGGGNDTYYVQDANDLVMEAAAGGTDSVFASLVSYVLIEHVENLTLLGTYNINATGNDLDNVLVGNTGRNRLTGNAGNDTLDGGLGIDTMVGGIGNDTYHIDSASDLVAELLDEGIDTVISTLAAYTLGTHLENLTLGSNALGGTGNALANRLVGNDGDNVLDGGAGADTLVGGLGDDTYHVDIAEDVVTEGSGQGADTVISGAISYTLGVNIEDLILGVGALNGTGNSLSNSIIGNAADNVLNGGSGADTMEGGLGDDTYYVDNVGDEVVEEAGGGRDAVYASLISYVLGENLEHLTLLGTYNINGTGNGLDNSLTGNLGRNRLTGDAGADTLDGGLGIDTMLGGLGDDTYHVDLATDVVTEAIGEGYDTVISEAESYTLAKNVERLMLNAEAVSGTGNALDNLIVGNDEANLLDGGSGADTLQGGRGDDTYYVQDAGDLVLEDFGEGTDTVYASLVSHTLGSNVENLTLLGTYNINSTGNDLDNILVGNTGRNRLSGESGSDTLDGGLGIDTLIGGLGDDRFVFNTPPSDINADIISDFATGDKLVLHIDVFGDLSSDQLAFGNAPSGADHRLIYNGVTGVLLYDADGSGDGVAVKVATLSNKYGLTFSDLEFV